MVRMAFAVRDVRMDLDLRNDLGEFKTKGTCSFGKCDEMDGWKYCYEWVPLGGNLGGALTCAGDKFGGIAGKSILSDNRLAAASKDAFTIVDVDRSQCAYYRDPEAPGKATKVSFGTNQVQEYDKTGFVWVPQEDGDVKWVNVQSSFTTVAMTGCSILAKFESDVWKVVHLPSKHINTVMQDENVKVVFPQVRGYPDPLTTDFAGHWVWGKTNTGGELELYVGLIQEEAVTYNNALGAMNVPSPETNKHCKNLLDTSQLRYCKKVTFSRGTR